MWYRGKNATYNCNFFITEITIFEQISLAEKYHLDDDVKAGTAKMKAFKGLLRYDLWRINMSERNLQCFPGRSCSGIVHNHHKSVQPTKNLSANIVVGWQL